MSPLQAAAAAAGAIILIAAAVLATKISIRIQYSDSLTVSGKIAIVSFKLYPPRSDKKKKRKKEKKLRSKQHKEKPSFKDRLSAMSPGHKIDIAKIIINKFIRRLYFDILKIHITVSSPEASDTAVKYGRLCALIYPPAAMLEQYGHAKNADISLRTDFNAASSAYDIDISVRTRIVYALSVLIEVFKMTV